MKFGNNLEIGKNQLVDAVAQLIAGNHGSPINGIFWYDSTNHVFKGQAGGAIITFGTVGGAAPDSSLLNGEAGTFYLDRANHTGQQAAATISDFDTAADVRVNAGITALIASAPTALNTLDELAAALGDDANFAATVTTSLGTKAAKYATAIGDNSATSIDVVHNLNTRDVIVEVYRATTPWDRVFCNIDHKDVNTVTASFSVAPTAGQYRVVVHG